jgi:hypothetical protein
VIRSAIPSLIKHYCSNIVDTILLLCLRSNRNFDDVNELASRVVRGAELHPSHGLIVVPSEVLPAHSPLVCEESLASRNEMKSDEWEYN